MPNFVERIAVYSIYLPRKPSNAGDEYLTSTLNRFCDMLKLLISLLAKDRSSEILNLVLWILLVSRGPLDT